MDNKIISRIIVTTLLIVASCTDASAQAMQKIGKNSFTINPKAVLELESTTKGFLPPRMTVQNQTDMAIGAPLPAGLIVYVTDTAIPGLQIWNGSAWVAFVDTEALDLKANATDLDVKVDKVDGERLINAAEITNLGNQS
ncbi:MAG: hypothetical protein V7692_15240, partial [Maribacter arcticus]